VSAPVRVAVVGCGLIGRRRATVAKACPASSVSVVVDVHRPAAEQLAADIGCRVAADWREAATAPDVDVVVVSTPNAYLLPVALAALESGKHVLLEKPMGRNVDEARRILQSAATHKRIVKVGFNHRYHPAIEQAHRRFAAGEIGELRSIRVRYGHGGRPGYEREWRGDPNLAGGGELTDQGVHVLDLLLWFAGEPENVYGVLQTAAWPIAPLEDNGFALLKYPGGAVASFHTSWTQWKNLFSFEVYGTAGSLTVEGLGKSYGTERLLVAKRRPEGGVPETEELAFEGEDLSWAHEWEDFLGGLDGKAYRGNPEDGVAVMTALDALYRSAQAGVPVSLESQRKELVAS
jgi:predicted dehydrogenase